MRVKYSILIMIILFLNIFLQAGDFRKCSWGMNPEQVKEMEAGCTVYAEENGCILYLSTVANYKCIVAYYFTKNKLTSAFYKLDEPHTNLNDYIEDYLIIYKLILKKYGGPNDFPGPIRWDNTLYKSDNSQWGFAISLGHLTYLSQWDTDTTYITSLLSGENYKISIFLRYESVKFKDLVDELSEESNLEDF